MHKYCQWTALEWRSVREVASWYGVTTQTVRLAIQRCQRRALGAYAGDGWTVYAEKRGSEWRVPVLLRKEQSIRGNEVRDNIISVRTFPSRTAYLEWCERAEQNTKGVSDA